MAVEGLSALQQKLKMVPQKVIDAMEKALEESAEEIVQMMRGLAPSDSGNLRASIGWTWGDAPKGSMRMGAVKYDSSGNKGFLKKITIYAGGVSSTTGDAFYARFVEFGTKPHALGRNASTARGLRQDQGGLHPGSQAQPFFYPSYRANKSKTKARVTRAVRKAIKDV